MKTKLIRGVTLASLSTSLILLVLVGVTASTRLSTSPSNQIDTKDKQCVMEGVDSIRGLYYAPEGIAWSEQIRGTRRKQRPYRNPVRRYRLSKKQKRDLRRKAERADKLFGSGEKVTSATPTARMLFIDDSCGSARWG